MVFICACRRDVIACITAKGPIRFPGILSLLVCTFLLNHAASMRESDKTPKLHYR